MAKPNKNAKDKLGQLAEYLRHGWKAKYPVQEEDLSRLRDEMKKIWKEKEKLQKDRPDGHTQAANEDKVQDREPGQWPEKEPEQEHEQDGDQENDQDQGQEHER